LVNKKLIVLLAFLCFTLLTNGQETTTFILVRHAEKADDGTQNPPLNKEGKLRAEELAELLQNQEITRLYSTPYKRTKETLQPIADQKGLEILSYEPHAKEKWLKQLLKGYPLGCVVVSGHSNTIPVLANILLGKRVFSQFADDDYSNLIIIVASKVGEGKLVRLSF